VNPIYEDCWRSQFHRNQFADKPGFQARDERTLHVFQTSPAVAHELALTTADENGYTGCWTVDEEGRLILVPPACQQ
jgi:hypothetical protein